MNFKALWGSAAMVAMVASGQAWAQQSEAEELAARFGARPTVLDISLSPSGDQVAYISSDNSTTEVVYVVDLTSEGEPRALTSLAESDAELTNCDWVNEIWLVCRVLGVSESGGRVPLYYTRMLSIATDGSEPNLLTAPQSFSSYGVMQDGGSVIALDVEGEENRILMTRDFLPEVTIRTNLANDEPGLGVELVDVARVRRRTVEDPDEFATRYIADENGEIRLKVRRPMNDNGRLTGESEFLYREAGSSRWQMFEEGLSDFSPVAVDARSNSAYGFRQRGGFQALYRVPLDGTSESELVIARDDVDIDRLIRIGRQQRVVGVSYATEKRQVEYLDEDLGRLAEQLEEALPGNPLISIVDASADERTLLIVASSDVDPGMSYLLERDSNSLSPLLPLRDHLVDRAMAPMRPVTFPAADGTQIPGYLTLPEGAEGPMPAIVLPHGGPGSRDEWGFDWLVQFLASRGYAVLQPNFRGSSGYGEAWFGRNGFQEWETAIGDVNDAGRWLVEEGLADPSQMGVMGWSYGGYAALQSQVLDPSLYKAVVAIAPVTDLDLLVEQSRDYTNYQLVRRFVGSGPHVDAGSPAEHADRFQAPVLLFHGTRDLNTSHLQSRRMEERLKSAGADVQYVEFDGYDHYLDNGLLRGNMLYRIDGFLAQHLGGGGDVVAAAQSSSSPEM
ncbi:alpha/beta hydrolase family protein [Aurantiacibacter poecillastricola]|uniref:alpha/beta hydrolase family protein n=1 Tax=Aurantiacibacter poecillastricola TaxID=3064385 RepID=UPI00273DD44C|nr:S9 family peptidase [Aurantiacibacter sp. 219JJ12-13]MDP5261929.1 S9 family peptidase [Aurantiacibacter sp. 219JJ12-13]